MSKQADEFVTEENKTKPAKHWASFFFLYLMIILLVGIVGLAYLQLTRVNKALTEQISVLQQQTTSDTQQLQALNESVRHLQQVDTSDIRTTILNRWYVTEAQYLVRLAKNYMLFMHNMPAGLVLLQQADQVLQNVQDGSVDAMRQQLAQYISTLSALPVVDINAIYAQLNAVNSQLDKLPLPISPLQQDKSTVEAVDEAGLPWWKKGLNHTVQALREIVIVRYNSSNTLPLVTPEDKNFLLLNLHAEMENAMWALIHHNDAVYQASLTHVIEWVQQYFVQTTSATINLLQALNALKATNIEPQPVDVVALLRQFDEYLKS